MSPERPQLYRPEALERLSRPLVTRMEVSFPGKVLGILGLLTLLTTALVLVVCWLLWRGLA